MFNMMRSHDEDGQPGHEPMLVDPDVFQDSLNNAMGEVERQERQDATALVAVESIQKARAYIENSQEVMSASRLRETLSTEKERYTEHANSLKQFIGIAKAQLEEVDRNIQACDQGLSVLDKGKKQKE